MKKVILIGDTGYFPDSLIWFKEQGFEVTHVVLHNRLPWLKKTSDIFHDFGYNSISIDEIEHLYPLLDKDTLVLSGNTFCGDVYSFVHDGAQPSTIERFEAIYNLSKYNSENSKGAKIVCYFCGDAGFGTQRMVDFFNEKIQYVDYLLFDNELLREFFLTNSEVARTKQILIGWLETPLKRFVLHNQGKIQKQIISLGRCISAFNDVLENNKNLFPIKFFPLKKPKKQKGFLSKIKTQIYLFYKKRVHQKAYSIAMEAGMKNLSKHRKRFLKHESMNAFGASHMYDTFYNANADFRKNKDFYFSLEGQMYAHNAGAIKEVYYPFINNPNKEACYMMYGIIPLISNTENPYYKELLGKKMAILIEKPEDFKKVLEMSDEEIQQYRDNIYANQDVFTFDHVGEMLVKLLDN